MRREPGSVPGHIGKNIGIAISCLNTVDPSNPNCQVLWITDYSKPWNVGTFFKLVTTNGSSIHSQAASSTDESRQITNSITYQAWEPRVEPPPHIFKQKAKEVGFVRQRVYHKKDYNPLVSHIIMVTMDDFLAMLTGKDHNDGDIVYYDQDAPISKSSIAKESSTQTITVICYKNI